MNIKIISAGAGSGKTYRLTEEMVQLLQGQVRANGIIATTFTKKAAAELQERVRIRLLESGMTAEADDLANALIGTVHGLGVKLLQRFAFEAGVSPEVDIIAEEDQQILFNQSLSTVLTHERVTAMELLSDRLGLNKRGSYDWRRDVMQLTEVARANAFDSATLEKSKRLSFERFQQFLPEAEAWTKAAFNEQLQAHLSETIEQLEQNEDTTKTTQSVVKNLKNFQRELELRGELFWHVLVKISKEKVGAKSRDDFAPLAEFAQKHESLPEFHEDIQAFIHNLFDIAIAAIEEFDTYKKSRGLIDYTDMEVHISRLLDHPQVQEVLAEELDLLMVDEFQDTSPIQLEIFLKLSKLAKYSVWVGDPKQSIYGFRGADPQLMRAVIQEVGGVKAEDIQTHSWRSREEIVFAVNALFTKAFSDIPAEQVALRPKRTKMNGLNGDEPIEVNEALHHWHFQYEGKGRPPGKPWFENCIAEALQQFLQGNRLVLPKGEKNWRQVQPGDVAILCRSNRECQQMAEALHRAGLKAAIARSGLLETAEAKLILACLKFVLNKQDSLSVAEILLLAGGQTLETIIEDRLKYLKDQKDSGGGGSSWAMSNDFIRQLNDLRERVAELSSSEILNLLLEELDLRRLIAAWGRVDQRLDNVDVLRRMAVQYEEACSRLHTAASLGGFLLWLNELENRGEDEQGSGEGPDAVNVLTYHKSKGLEWPVVICHSLEKRMRAEVWGMEIIPEQEEVDLNNVLGNRWLRYWVSPYADQYQNTPLQERIQESDFQKNVQAQALQEEARLLYVGLTRARDYLVFPSRQKVPTRWLNRVWHEGQEDFPTLQAETWETPWEWNGQFLNAETETFTFPKDFTVAEGTVEQIPFLEERAGRQVYEPYLIDLRKEQASKFCRIRSVQSQTYAAPLRLKVEDEQYNIAKTFKAFLAADHPERPEAERLALAKALIERTELDDFVEASSFVHSATAYHQHLQRFDIKRQFRKYPIRFPVHDRLFETVADLIIETPDTFLLLQNTTFAGTSSKWRDKAKELGSWLFLSRLALEKLFPGKPVRTYVHFVMGGGLVEVQTEAVQKQLELWRE